MEREQLRIAIYARPSTKNGQDPEMQLAELRESAIGNGKSLVNMWIEESPAPLILGRNSNG